MFPSARLPRRRRRRSSFLEVTPAGAPVRRAGEATTPPWQIGCTLTGASGGGQNDSMTDDSAPPTRRRWREEHRPVVRHWRHGFFTAFRRGDPVFVIAAYLLAAACAGMGSGAVGGRGAFRITPDESAVVITVSAAVFSMALLGIAIRLPFTRSDVPLSLGGVIFGVGLTAVSTTVVIARAEGVLSSAVWTMFGSLAVCAVIAAVTVPLALRRRRGSTRGEEGIGVPAAERNSSTTAA